MNTTKTNEELWRQWENLVKTKPPNPKRKPTVDELQRLQEFKCARQLFLKKIPIEQASWFHEKRMASRRMSKVKPPTKTRPPKPPHVILCSKPTPVCLGWNPDEKFIFCNVIPFLSHSRRSRYEEEKDREMSSSIDR